MKSLTESILGNPEDIMNGAETDAIKTIAELVRTMKQIAPKSAEERTTKRDVDAFGNKLDVGDIFLNFGNVVYPVVGYYIYGIKRKRLIAKQFIYEKGQVIESGEEVYVDGIYGKIKWPIKI